MSTLGSLGQCLCPHWVLFANTCPHWAVLIKIYMKDSSGHCISSLDNHGLIVHIGQLMPKYVHTGHPGKLWP